MCLALSLLYRGTLSSCNYECPYCPFAKHWESPEELAHDQQGLQRFVEWVKSRRDDRLSLFFTPWGEALVREWYRRAVVELSRLEVVQRVAVQTNLSCNLDWLATAVVEKIGLWCTYHPGQTALGKFLDQCRRLEELGVAYSVGCVGLREHREEIETLRARLPRSTYLWINAYKSDPTHYDDELLAAYTTIDPHFPTNTVRHPSYQRACRTGETSITVDSAGDLRRCHFVDEVIGNLYRPDFERALRTRPCPNETCGCHIGYVHLEHLGLENIYGGGILERIPLSHQAGGPIAAENLAGAARKRATS